MASSYSTDLKLELMVTGENAGTWGDITNTNLNLLQQAIGGYQEVSIAGGAQTTTLVMSNAALSNARNAVIKLIGAITGNQIVTVPDGIEKTYIVSNGTTGAFTVQFKTATGTGITFATTDKSTKIFFADGTNIVDVGMVSETGVQTLTNKTLTTPVISSISNTGTLTLPTSTDTLVGRATTDTLTNKTFTAPKYADGGFIADANGNEEIKFTTTASAVNEITVANAATGSSPTISATGGDTNIGINLTPKGTGGIVLGAGAVATPALTTSGNLNTGIFFPAADTIAFTKGGAEAMRINSSGNVGIGTTSPNYKLQVRTSNDKNLYIRDGYRLAGVALQSVNNAESLNVPLEINADGAQLTLSGTPITFTNSGTERMRIDSSGRLLLAYTSLPTNGGILSVNGDISAGSAYKTKAGSSAGIGANGFNIEWTGSAQLWIDTTNVGTITLTSDYRIKRNIETQTAPALNRIMALRPVTFQMADYGTLFKASDDIKEGFIAHEVQEVIPSGAEGVKDAENQIQSLRVDAILAVTVKAIQEQQAIIEELKTTTTSQQTKINALEARLIALES
jgi:hypothetical protein